MGDAFDLVEEVDANTLPAMVWIDEPQCDRFGVEIDEAPAQDRVSAFDDHYLPVLAPEQVRQARFRRFNGAVFEGIGTMWPNVTKGVISDAA